MQKVQRQQQNQQPVATTQMGASSPRQGQTQTAGNGSAAVSPSSGQQASQSTRYQTRQAVKGRIHDGIQMKIYAVFVQNV